MERRRADVVEDRDQRAFLQHPLPQAAPHVLLPSKAIEVHSRAAGSVPLPLRIHWPIPGSWRWQQPRTAELGAEVTGEVQSKEGSRACEDVSEALKSSIPDASATETPTMWRGGDQPVAASMNDLPSCIQSEARPAEGSTTFAIKMLKSASSSPPAPLSPLLRPSSPVSRSRNLTDGHLEMS
eukprot:766762-Hanusia_phi.AAC.9